MKDIEKKRLRNLFIVLGATPENRVSELLDRLSSESAEDNGVAFLDMYECTRGEMLNALHSLLKPYVN